MNPGSALALTASMDDIAAKLYAFGNDLEDGLDELGCLCTKLFALQAALNNAALNMRFASTWSWSFFDRLAKDSLILAP